MADYLQVANDPMLWLMCAPVVLMVLVQAYLFGKRAFASAHLAGISEDQCRLALRVGAVSSVGPALAVFVVLMGMMAVVGAPVTWQRLDIIGAATTELTATDMGAVAWGAEVGTPEYGVMGFATSVWVMALNGCGWLLFCGLFTHRLEWVMHKVTGGSLAIMTTVCGAAVLGTSSYLAVNQAVRNTPNLTAVITGAVVMAFFQLAVAPRFPKIREWNLGIAMVCGMAVGTLVMLAG